MLLHAGQFVISLTINKLHGTLLLLQQSLGCYLGTQEAEQPLGFAAPTV